MKKIKIVDTTLRDAHQSLWSTRMTTAMMSPVAKDFNNVGFEAIDFMAMIQYDVSVRYLRENPWERIRFIKKQIPDTPLRGHIRNRNLIGFDLAPEDVTELMIENKIKNGFDEIKIFDALFDFDNIISSLNLIKKLGAKACLALNFSESPIHTDELYARKAKEAIERANIDKIFIKDSSGLLTPSRIKTLVPALKKVIGDIPLELHSHCLTGLAPLVYLEGVKAGVDIIDTSIPPLANGPAQPNMQTVVRNLRDMGYEINVNDQLVEKISKHFYEVAEYENKPIGTPMEYDAFHYEHQMPGGMLTNFKYQLEQAGISDKFDEVMNEVKLIRQELAWPIMVTPFAQLIATQAVYNVLHEERYSVVPDEVKKYVLGYYGKPLAPIQQDVLDRIVETGSQKIPINPEPLQPAVPELRKKYPNLSDEERLLRFMIPGKFVDDMNSAGPLNTDYNIVNTPLVKLVKNLASRPKLGHFYIKDNSLSLEIGGANEKK